MKYSKIFLVLTLWILSPTVSLAQDLSSPVHVKVENGWKVFYPLNKQYVSFIVKSPDIEVESAYSMVLSKKTGIHFTLADKNQWSSSKNLLDGYIEWELNYMRSQFSDLESRTIQNVQQPNKNILVTEITFPSSSNIAYILAIATIDGVVAITISSSASEKDSLMAIVKSIMDSTAIENKALSLEDIKNFSTLLRKDK